MTQTNFFFQYKNVQYWPSRLIRIIVIFTTTIQRKYTFDTTKSLTSFISHIEYDFLNAHVKRT